MVPQTGGTNRLLSLRPFGHKAIRPKVIRLSYSIILAIPTIITATLKIYIIIIIIAYLQREQYTCSVIATDSVETALECHEGPQTARGAQVCDDRPRVIVGVIGLHCVQ